MKGKHLLFSAICFLLLLFGYAACNPYAEVERDRKSFSRISSGRTVGGPCFPGDSASIKRRSSHPMGPTGGWYGASRVDYARSRPGEKSYLTFSYDKLVGYVRGNRPGFLRLRAYDDVYGEVYCGWLNEKIALKPSAERVFVSLPQCAVGDGWVDTVIEVCWFPEGESRGEVIFSSTHMVLDPSVSILDLHDRSELGADNYFRSGLAIEMIDAQIRLEQVEEARETLQQGIDAFKRQRAVDGLSKLPIEASDFQRDIWLELLSIKLGLAIAESEFEAVAGELDDATQRKTALSCAYCDSYAKLLPVYRYLGNRLGGKNPDKPEYEGKAFVIDSQNSAQMVAYLSADMSDMEFVKLCRGAQSCRFLVGAKAFLDKRVEDAKKELSAYLQAQDAGIFSHFRRAAAAKLLAASHPVLAPPFTATE